MYCLGVIEMFVHLYLCHDKKKSEKEDHEAGKHVYKVVDHIKYSSVSATWTRNGN